jgi:hypothetical protein
MSERILKNTTIPQSGIVERIWVSPSLKYKEDVLSETKNGSPEKHNDSAKRNC